MGPSTPVREESAATRDVEEVREKTGEEPREKTGGEPRERTVDEPREADLSNEESVIVLSILGVIGGSLLPWAREAGVAVYGFEVSGLSTSILGLVAGGVAYWYGWTAETLLTAAIVGAFVAVIAVFALDGAAIGVYVTLVAAVPLTIGAVHGYRKVRAGPS